MLRRIFSLLLCFTMVLSLIPGQVFAVGDLSESMVAIDVPDTVVEMEPQQQEMVEETLYEAPSLTSVEETTVFAMQPAEPVSVTSIEITAETDCIAPGETLQLTATVFPEDAADQPIIWSSQDESVLTVDENGLVAGVASGCTFVVAAAADGSEVEAQYEIAVFDEMVQEEIGLFAAQTIQSANAQTGEGLVFPIWADETGKYKDGPTMITYGYLNTLQGTESALKQWEKYGTNILGTHHGTEYYALDISGSNAGFGAVVHAVAAGKVVDYRSADGQVTLEHNGLTLLDGNKVGTWYSTYVHMQKNAILEYLPNIDNYKTEPVYVNCGQKIGAVGNTSSYLSVPTHLHFSMTTMVRNSGSFHWGDNASGFSDDNQKVNAVLEYANAALNPAWVYSNLTKEDIIVYNENGVRITSANDMNANPADIEAWMRFDLTYDSNIGGSGGEQLRSNSFSFNSGIDGSAGSMSSFSATPGKTFVMPQNGFSYTGFEVIGWNLKRNDGLWLTNRGTFASEEDAATLGYYTFFSGYGYTFNEDWAVGEDCNFTFYPIWQESDSDTETEESLRTELESGNTKIKLQGNVVLDKDLIVPEGTTLTVASGKTLTVPQGVKLTNNGEIIVGEQYAESKSFLKLYGVCENNGEITIHDGGVENESVFNNEGELNVAGWGSVHFINSGTMTNNGRIFVSGAQDAVLDAQFINSGTYTQTESASFQQWNGYVTGVSPTNIDLQLYAQVTTADIQELIDANYENVSLYVQNDYLTITQDLTLPDGFSFLFEGSILTIPEDVRLTIDTSGFCELSRDSICSTTVNVLGELYCNKGRTELWDNGTMTVSGEVVVNSEFLAKGKLNLLDGGKLTNYGSIHNYSVPVNIQTADDAALLNYGYIAGVNEQTNSKDVIVNGTVYDYYYGAQRLTDTDVAEILEADGIYATDISMIWQGPLACPEEGSEATITVNNYDGSWYLLGAGVYDNGWGVAQICDEPTQSLWYGDSWLYNYAVVLGKEVPREIWITEDTRLTEDMIIHEETTAYISEGVTVTVPAGVELNIQGYMEVYGNLIFEDGSILTITDERYQRLCIWTGTLDATGADLSGVPYGAVELQLNSRAEVAGIPDSMLYATTYVYDAEDINAALTQASDYAMLLMMVDTSFYLTDNITIPDNAELFIWRWNSIADYPSVVIPDGVTVTNNGWITVDSGRLVVEEEAKLINNSYVADRDFGAMIVLGEFQQNGVLNGDYYGRAMTQAELESALDYAAECDRGRGHEYETIITSDMTIDLGSNAFYLSKYGRIIVSNGATLTIDSMVYTYSWDYGDLELGQIIVENGGKLIVNGVLETAGGLVAHGETTGELILENGSYLEINGVLLANEVIEIGPDTVVEVNGYWDGFAPRNEGGTILPEVTSISISTSKNVVNAETIDHVALQLSVNPGTILGATWTSSDHEIIDPAQIKDNCYGEYKAYLGEKSGTVTLTATSIDGSGKSASITLEIVGADICTEDHNFGEWVILDDKRQRICQLCGYTEENIDIYNGNVLIGMLEQPGLTFEVNTISPGEEQYAVVQEALAIMTDPEQVALRVFDINLIDHDGMNVQPEGIVKVQLPLDSNRESDYKVYRVNADNSLTDMCAYRQENYMVFETDHFSLYVIVEGHFLGDLDLDGDVDAYDLTMMARHVGGIETVQSLSNADMDGDGDVDAYDLTKHARYVGGIITDWNQD